MRALALRALRLFVDSVWLAVGACIVVAAAAVAARAGVAPRAVGGLMLAGLAGTLGGSVVAAVRRWPGRRSVSLRSGRGLGHDGG